MNSDTNVMNSKKMILKVIFILVLILLLVTGGTYAYWTWYSTVNKDVVFSTADVEDYIVYDEGNSYFIGNFLPVDSFCESVNTTLSFYKMNNAPSMMKFTASIKMDINSIGDNIAQSNDIYWVVTSGDNTISCANGLNSTGVVAYGTFNGVSAGETIDLVNDIEVTFEEQRYTVWIWIDSTGSNLSSLSKETIDTNVWTLISMEERTNKINFDLQGGTFDNVSYTTSGEHTYVVPCDGIYKLEVWGASGGTGANSYTPGYGGYSVGNIELEQDTNIFINVGGTGSNASNSGTYTNGGHNGGGGANYRAGTGGGATHIALVSGALSSLSATNNINDILIVAGGGGGAGYYNTNLNGGSGGGITGVDGGDYSTSYQAGGHGGTQSAGGALGSNTSTVGTTGAFGSGGQGGYGSSRGSGGGGGGFYGGAGGSGYRGGGGGGSGYIGNSLLTDKAMYCYNCAPDSNASTLTYSVGQAYDVATSSYAKSGDGAAKITLLDISKVLKLGATYGTLMVPEKENQFFVGWNTKSDGTGAFINSNSIFNENNGDTLYAIWSSLPEYTVSYDANGGSGAPSAQTKTYGVDLTISSTKPTRDGYMFLGWSASSEATSATYSAGGTYTENTAITLYAVWEEKTSINPISSYSCANGSAGSEPYDLVYSGNCTVIDDGNGNWRVKFLSTGTKTLTVATDTQIDVFLVGGGGGGKSNLGGGGGGGYTKTALVSVIANTSYDITIGAGGGSDSNGGTTSGFNLTASGGYAGSIGGGGSGGGGSGVGGSDTNGGAGGSDGGNGSAGGGGSGGGTGQGTTTREFGESTGTLYSGGGGGATYYGTAGSGGSGGGGLGGSSYGSGKNGTANTGGGGGGGSGNASGGTGGSGIVIIRNARNS